MKKLLSVILSLVLILGTVFAVPAVTVSAATESGADIAAATWTDSTGQQSTGNGIYGPYENNTIKFYGWMHYRSFYTKLTGLAQNTTYEITFNYSGIAVSNGGIIAANVEKPTYDGNNALQGDKYGRFTVDTTNKKGTFYFTTDENTEYFLSIQTGAAEDTSSISCVFSYFTMNKIDSETALGNAIADGEWYKINEWTTFTHDYANHSIRISNMAYQDLYTNITGLKTNTTYELTYNHNLESSSSLFSNPINIYAGANVTSGTAIASGNHNNSNSVYTKITFTTDSTNTDYTLKLHSHKCDGDGAGLNADSALDANVTLSNFVLREKTAEEIAGGIIANGEWKITTYAGGTVSQNKNLYSVSFTGANSQVAYTTLTGLTVNGIYELSFTTSAEGVPSQAYMVDADETLTFYDWMVPSNESTVAASLTADGTRITVTFTATAESIQLTLRNSTSTSSFALTNFNFGLVRVISEAELAGKELANNGNWAVTQGAGGTITKSNGTVTVTGAQYQTLSVPLTGLEKNTTYTLTLDHSAGDQWQFANPAYVIPGETAWSSGLNSKEGTVSFSNGSCNTATTTTIKFTTNSTDSDYLVAFICNAPYYNGTLGTVVLSNFNLAKETAYEFAGTAIRAAREEVTQGMRFKNKISKKLIADGYNGKAVVEYGTLAAFDANLNGAELTYAAVDGRKVKKGVAYNTSDSINVVFEEDDNTVTYTAALVGINTKYYGLEIKTRSYILLSDGSVVYGEAQSYSVYSMFNAILAGDSENDQAVVNAILEDEEILNGYNAWLVANAQ